MWFLLLLSCADDEIEKDNKAVVREEVQLEMSFHLGDIERARDAVVAGDLPAAKGALAALGARLPVDGLPAKLAPYQDQLLPIVTRGATAATIGEAATAVGEAMATCGACHQAAGAHPGINAAVPERLVGPTEWMARHQWASRRLEVGLVEPLDAAISEASVVLTLVPVFGELPDGRALPPEAAAMVEKVHASVAAAAAAKEPLLRGRAYGEMLATCAACHTAYRKTPGPTP